MKCCNCYWNGLPMRVTCKAGMTTQSQSLIAASPTGLNQLFQTKKEDVEITNQEIIEQ